MIQKYPSICSPCFKSSSRRLISKAGLPARSGHSECDYEGECNKHTLCPDKKSAPVSVFLWRWLGGISRIFFLCSWREHHNKNMGRARGPRGPLICCWRPSIYCPPMGIKRGCGYIRKACGTLNLWTMSSRMNRPHTKTTLSYTFILMLVKAQKIVVQK